MLIKLPCSLELLLFFFLMFFSNSSSWQFQREAKYWLWPWEWTCLLSTDPWRVCGWAQGKPAPWYGTYFPTFSIAFSWTLLPALQICTQPTAQTGVLPVTWSRSCGELNLVFLTARMKGGKCRGRWIICKLFFRPLRNWRVQVSPVELQNYVFK